MIPTTVTSLTICLALYGTVAHTASVQASVAPVVARLSEYSLKHAAETASPSVHVMKVRSLKGPPRSLKLGFPSSSSGKQHKTKSTKSHMTTVTTTTIPSTIQPTMMKTITTTTTTTTTTVTTTTSTKKDTYSLRSKTIRMPLRRVYTTNALEGFRRDRPSLFPPGFGGLYAHNHTVLDVGANNGDDYTLRAALGGHTVLSFEPSKKLHPMFKQMMHENRVPLSVVQAPSQNTSTRAQLRLIGGSSDPGYNSINGKVLIPRDVAGHPRVYLIPFALSNESGEAEFYEAKCRSSYKCGKLNRLSQKGDVQANTRVQKYRLDDLTLPVNTSSIWFMKIDVEGHELEVLKGARNLLKAGNVEYIAVEFSSNGRKGIKWGVDLLEELYSQGYSCFHLRGFGKCHNNRVRLPSMKCNYPFSTLHLSRAPSFKQYTQVFEINNKNAGSKPRMSDLMCKKMGKFT